MSVFRPVLLVALLLAGCAPAAPGGAVPSAAPSVDPEPPVKPEDFRPTKVALTIDGKPATVALKGYLNVGTDRLLTGALGAYKGDKAGTAELHQPSFNITGKGPKAISAPDFTIDDAASVLIGMNWTRNTFARVFTPVGSATVVLTPKDGKLSLSYSGTMNRGPGNGEFPETIAVTLEAEGIPTKKP